MKSESAKHALTTRKKILFTIITLAVGVVFLESAARAMYYVREGFNPYYLSFGFVTDTQFHSAEGPGYSKFPPNTVYHQKTHQRTVDMGINADGFRNPQDFVRPKPAGTIRVLAMGESSTFGYGLNEDDQTYPYQLEQLLKQRYPERRIEVYNLGIPHFRSNNIVALAKTEAESLEPDLITVYAGYNNAILPKPRTEAGSVYHLKDWLYFHSVAWRVVHTSVRNLYYKFVAVTNADPVGLPNLAAPVELDSTAVQKLREHSRQEYRQDLEELANTAERLHSKLLLITQSYTLYSVTGSGLQDKWRTYQEEVDAIEALYNRDKHLSAIQASLLVHRDLMDELRDLSERRGVPLLDGIRVLDTNRPEGMASYVHLTPTGNTMLATAIANSIGEMSVVSNQTGAIHHSAATQIGVQ